MTQPSPWLDVVRRIVAEVARSDASELELSRGSFRVLVKRRPTAALAEIAIPQAEPPLAPEPQGHVVTAPLTGIFYRAPSPASPPYVVIGDEVEPHTTIGLIEAMKVFNEVAAEARGRVSALYAQSGQLVHAGDPLLSIDSEAEPGGGPEVAE